MCPLGPQAQGEGEAMLGPVAELGLPAGSIWGRILPAAEPRPEQETGKEGKGAGASSLGAGAGVAQPTCSVCWMVLGKYRRVQRGKVSSLGTPAGPSGLVRWGTMASTFPRGPSVPESSSGVRQRKQRLSK